MIWAIAAPQFAASDNSEAARLKSCKRAGLPVPEQLLNGRHNLLAS